MRFAVLLFLPIALFSRGYEPFLSFSASKTALHKIYANYKTLPLSNCKYYFSKEDCSTLGYVDFNSCSYEQYIDKEAAKTIGYIHVVKPEEFAKDLRCMNEKVSTSTVSGKPIKGLRCCKKINKSFRKMYSDMHNILPVIGEIQNIDQLILTKENRAMIARIKLYMHDNYGISIRKNIINEAKLSKPTLFEKDIHKKIYEKQGTYNIYVEELGYNPALKGK